MSEPKQPAPAPAPPKPSSTVSYGAGTLPAAQQRPAAPLPPPVPAPAAQPNTAAAAQPTAAPAAKGPLGPRTVEIVQRSWAQVMPISDAAAGLFYDRLFEMDPSVRPLFKNDMAQQKKKLMQMLNLAVDGLTNPQRLVPVLEQLGARHAGYMVQDHHYGLVGEALLWTLREGLGDAFTPETESAWREVYTLVATVMKKAAASGVATKPPVSPPAPPAAPPVPEEMEVEWEAPPLPAEPRSNVSVGDQTMPYPMLAQTRLLGLPPFPQPPVRDDLSIEARTSGLPVAAPSTAQVSIPLNVPKEVTVNFHVNVKLEADPALAAALRAPAPAPTPAPAAPAPAPKPVPVEPAAPSRATVSPVLLVALCVLVSVSTVVALGPLGQAASSLALADLPRLAAPVFTLAALAVGYLWGRGRGGDRQK